MGEMLLYIGLCLMVLAFLSWIDQFKETPQCQCPDEVNSCNDLCAQCHVDLDAWMDEHMNPNPFDSGGRDVC